MALSSNVVRRGSVYYLRVAVPTDLQPSIKRREVWKSLRTKEPRDARRKGAEALSALHSEWEGMRTSAAERIELGRREMHEAAVQLYVDELTRDDQRRASLPTEAEIAAEEERLRSPAIAQRLDRLDGQDLALAIMDQALDLLAKRSVATHDSARRKVLLATLRRHAATGETHLIRWAADEAIQRDRLQVDVDSKGYRELCAALLRAWIEALERMNERDKGNFTGLPADPVLKPSPALDGPAVARPGESVLELFAVYEAENPRNIKTDTMRMNREIVHWFASFVGPRFPASGIDKVTVRDWKALLRKFPVKAAETREFRGLSFRKIVERNATLGKPTVSARTINKYLSALGAFCKWLIQHAYIETNPTIGMHTLLDKEIARVIPYSSEQLTTIFSSPLFTGCASAQRMDAPGEHRIRDHRYWLPLLSLFTGARLGELAQLLTADVRELHSQWIIHITREGGRGKSTKTKGSQRVMPVHPELIRLGFIAFHAERVKAGGEKLFEGAKRNTRDQIAGDFSKAFGGYLRKIGVKSDPSLNFHSFRHGFADALRRAGYRNEEFGFLLGHTKATTTGRYGVMPEGQLAQRVALVQAVSFDGLDLTPLHAK